MPTIIQIDNPNDPRTASYRDIRERDLVGREGLFIAEGRVVLRSLLASGLHETVSLLVADHRVTSLGDLLAGLPATVPVYAASQPVMDRIAGFPMHRGILGLGRRSAEPDVTTLLASTGPYARVLVLAGIANHDNMGGLFRNAAAFGVDAVILDSTSCDPLYRKAIRVSVGATLTVPFARLERDDDPVALLATQGFVALALSPSGNEILSDIVPPARAALIVGAEGPGLPADLMRQARTVRIPMAEGFDSLNVATAAAIALHHLTAGSGQS